MGATHLKVNSLGPIREADVRFGDLTVFVGLQVIGESIFLQLLKLTMREGLTRPFTDYRSGDPFSVRLASASIRSETR